MISEQNLTFEDFQIHLPFYQNVKNITVNIIIIKTECILHLKVPFIQFLIKISYMKNKDYVNVARHIIKSQVANGIMKYVYVVCILVMCNEIVEIKLT